LDCEKRMLERIVTVNVRIGRFSQKWEPLNTGLIPLAESTLPIYTQELGWVELIARWLIDSN
jgi:hypothetical protein